MLYRILCLRYLVFVQVQAQPLCDAFWKRKARKLFIHVLADLLPSSLYDPKDRNRDCTERQEWMNQFMTLEGSIERRGKANLMQDLTNGAQVAHT
jgi:hypothetical protein